MVAPGGCRLCRVRGGYGESQAGDDGGGCRDGDDSEAVGKTHVNPPSEEDALGWRVLTGIDEAPALR
jgi:hypothetical protein